MAGLIMAFLAGMVIGVASAVLGLLHLVEDLDEPADRQDCGPSTS